MESLLCLLSYLLLSLGVRSVRAGEADFWACVWPGLRLHFGAVVTGRFLERVGRAIFER
jgi:hypothetical protein